MKWRVDSTEENSWSVKPGRIGISRDLRWSIRLLEYAAKEKQTSFDLGGPLGAFIKGFGGWVWVVVAVAAIYLVDEEGKKRGCFSKGGFKEDDRRIVRSVGNSEREIFD